LVAASKKRKKREEVQEEEEEEDEEEDEDYENEDEGNGESGEEGENGGDEEEGSGSGGDEGSASQHSAEDEGVVVMKAPRKSVGGRTYSPRKVNKFTKRRRVSLKGAGAAPWKYSNKKLGNVTLVSTFALFVEYFCICYNGHYFLFQETLKLSVEKVLKNVLRNSISMFSDKTLLSYVGMSILPKLKVVCTKGELKNAWENQGLGQQLMKIVRSTVNSRAQAIRTQTTANFGQIFRVKPKQGEELIAFYQGVRDKLSQLCNPHDKVAWNKWECMMRRAYCVPLGHISKSVNYLHCITVEQEAFALASLTWYFTGKRGLTIVSLVLMVFIVIPV
jgi:hypothetical protein